MFIDDDDRRYYLDLLGQILAKHSVALHAYVLMGNHVHLLTSADRAGNTSAALRIISQCYVQSFNRKYHRTGTLWEGRFKACLVDSEKYLLAVYRYIELNPVHAGMSESPQNYRWSSVHANLGLRHETIVTPHPAFIALGYDPDSRIAVYQSWLDEGIDDSQIAAIRAHLLQERAFGDEEISENGRENPESVRGTKAAR